jgi:hypothetical protein
VRKRRRRLDGIDEIVLSLTARGLTTGEVAAHFDEVYGAKVSKDTISRITDKVLDELGEWQNRPLDGLSGAVHRRDPRQGPRRAGDQPALLCRHRVTVDGHHDILGICAGEGGEGAKFWLHVLTEMKNRGVADACIVVCYGARKYWEQMARDLRPVYTASTEAAASARFAEFTATRGGQYPAIVALWRNAWSEFVPFLDYDIEIRRVIARPTRSSRSTPATSARSGRVDTSRPSRPRSSVSIPSPARSTRPGNAGRGLSSGISIPTGQRHYRDRTGGQGGAGSNPVVISAVSVAQDRVKLDCELYLHHVIGVSDFEAEDLLCST